MIIELEGTSYFLPNDFRDIELQEYIVLNNYIQDNKVSEESTDDEKLSFYINYITLFGVPREALNKVKLFVENDKEMGIINLFNYLWQFSQAPTKDQIQSFEKFVHKGVTYAFNSNSINLTGSERPMNDYTFEEFEESNSIMQSMAKVGKGQLEHLSLLCAIFYRPLMWKRFKRIIEPYNAESVLKRSKEFNTLPMDKVFRAYFFLLSQTITYNVNIVNSFLKEKELAAAS